MDDHEIEARLLAEVAAAYSVELARSPALQNLAKTWPLLVEPIWSMGYAAGRGAWIAEAREILRADRW